VTTEQIIQDAKVGLEVSEERQRQDAVWGEQNWPDGTGPWGESDRTKAQAWCEQMRRTGKISWRDILDEEICEAFAEVDPAKLRAELIQCAAVCQAWVSAIDRRYE
jgi:hypothetical protein